jgi:hypothetical protein
MSPKSIFEGIENDIHHALGIETGKHFKQKSTCRRLTSKTVDDEVLPKLVETLREKILSNWSSRIPSQENWRMERQTTLAAKNRSPEVVLERAIAMLGEQGVLKNWYNQIPVASGMIDDKADKRAAVDLIHVDGRNVDLVELKWGSDTPVFAAFEILQYGLAYLLCRDKQETFGYESKRLMQSERISLQVLAPVEFYSSYGLGFLATGIREGLDRLCAQRDDGLKMNFMFLSFPSDFQLPFSTGEEVLRQQGKSIDTGPNRLLIEAMTNLQPVWEKNTP